MTLLFRLDKGLRALAISQFLGDLSGAFMSVLNMFRMGPMEWTPMHISRFKQVISPTLGLMQGHSVSRFVNTFGTKRAFELGSFISAVGFLGWSQCWRTAASGNSGWWFATGIYTTVYVCFLSIMPSAANLTMKSMIVKHGLTVSDVGKGELS